MSSVSNPSGWAAIRTPQMCVFPVSTRYMPAVSANPTASITSTSIAGLANASRLMSRIALR